MSDQNNDLKSTLLSNEPMPEAVPVKATAIGQKEEVAVNPIPAASSLVVSKDPIDPVLQTTIEEFEVIFDKAVATTKTSKESHELPTPVRLTARLTDPSDANFYDILKGVFAAYLEKIDYAGLTKRIQQVEIDMNVNEAAIMLRASKEELNPYWYRISQAEIDIDGANSRIDLTASQLQLNINGIDYRLSQAQVDIDGANAQIALKASRTEIDDAVKRISSAEIAINGANAQIALKASKAEVSGALQRVSAAEIAIDGANAAIALKASKEEVNGVMSRVSAAEIAIDGANAAIELKASKEEVNGVTSRVSAAEISIDGANAEIALRATKSEVDAVTGRVTTAEASIKLNSDNIALKVSKTDFDPLATRVTTAETAITQNTTDIALRATKSDMDKLTGRVTTAEASIVTNAEQIALRVAKTEFDPVVGRVTTAESQITQYAGKIALMVAEDNTIKAGVIVDAINGGTVKIAANKVQIDGTTTFAPGYNPSETVRYLYIQENDPSLLWDTAYKEKMLNARWTKTSTTEDSVEYVYQNVAGSYVWVENSTVIDGGRIKTGILEAQYIDVDNLFAKELIATNMYVKNGRIGDFLINNNLTGSGYTNGTLNGNQIVLDPSNNEIVLSKNGVKRVRLTNNELTPLALLQVDGGTIACTNGTNVAWSTTNGIIASKNLLGVGGNGISKTMYVGINRPNPVIASTVEGIVKFNLQPGMYSLDMPFSLGVLHGKGFDVNSDKTDGRYNRITGVNDAFVTVKLMTATGVVSTQSFYVELKLDTVDTGNDTFFSRMARFNFSVSSAADYWMEVNYTIKGGSTRPIRYQSYNHATTFRHSYWSEQYGRAVHYDMRIDPGMTVDGSIGITELSNSGFQSVWTPTRYLRIDGNTANDIFIESQGRWLHNGIEIKFDKNTITGYIDQSVFATKSFVTQGYYNTTQSDANYLGKTAQATDSAKLGGQLPSYYSVATHNHDSVYLGINATAANSAKLGGVDAELYGRRWYDGWINNHGYDADTIAGSKSGFSYSNHCPYNGALVHFEAGGYGLQLSSDYIYDGVGLGFRTRNGDAGSWNSWKTLYHSGNLNRIDTDFVARYITTSADIITSGKITLTNYGNGTFNKAAIIGNASGLTLEGLIASDDFSGTKLPVTITWRGGYPQGGLQLRSGIVEIGKSTLQSNTYSGSGFTATGWGITTDGDVNFRNHIVRGKLTTYEFVQNKISIANGNMIVSDNAKCATAQRVYDSGKHIIFTFNIDDKCPFKVGDIIKCQSNGKLYQVTVDYVYPDLLRCDAYREDAVYDANIVANGDFLVRWNSTDAARKGLLYLCSSDAGSPNYQVLYDGAVKAQFGNLEGRVWNGAALPANTWGLWAENAYLSGAINATSGMVGNLYLQDGELRTLKTPSTGSLYAFFNNTGIGTVNSRNYLTNYFKTDGSGLLAKGNIAWDTAGNVTFSDSVKLQWQSGGRNYAPNSKETTISAYTDNYNFLTIPYYLEANTVYTFSAEASVVSGSISGYTVLVYDLTNNIGGPDSTFTVGSRGKFTFTSPNSSLFRILVYAGISGATANKSLKLIKYKIEKGYNATDWTPAQEDVDSKLTRIGPDGIYTGKIKAENIDGDILSGKTINAINTSERTILQLHGRDGTLTGFDDAGVIQSQLSRGSLTFYDSLGVPAVFLRNSDISLSECQNSGSISVAAVNSIPVGTGVSVSNGFSISNVGAYKGTIPMSISASGSIIVDESDGLIDVRCTVTVYASVDLEWLNPSTGLYEPYLNGVAYMSAYKSSPITSASCSKTGDANLSFTASKTGTFRLKFSHTRNCYGDAWSNGSYDRLNVVVSALDSTVSNTGTMLGSKVSNGTYIGNNGFISYKGTGSESFVVFDNSKGDFQFRVQANSEIFSLNKAIKLSINESGVDVIISGTTKLRVNNSGRIFIYGAPAVSTNVDGTGTNRYRLYLDEYNQLCRSPNNGW